MDHGVTLGELPAPSHPPVELLALLRTLAQLHHGGAEQSQRGMQRFGVGQPQGRDRHSQFHEEDDLPGCFDGIVELDEIVVVQLVHHIDLQQHHLLQKEPQCGVSALAVPLGQAVSPHQGHTECNTAATRLASFRPCPLPPASGSLWLPA